jgi:5-methylcytosine-specific restriction protein A
MQHAEVLFMNKAVIYSGARRGAIMALDDITDRGAVLKAVGEYDQLGEDEFCRKYGFGRSRTHWLEHDGRLYVSKAIMGAAHGYQFPEAGPLTPYDFHGGEPTIRKLQELGFRVEAVTDDEASDAKETSANPDWTRDEIILALDLYTRFGGNPPGKGSAEVQGLSRLLRRFHRLVGTPETPTLRNANGVYMKLMNLRRLDTRFQASGLSAGSKLEKEVWDEFQSDPTRLHRTAKAIEQTILREAEGPTDLTTLGEDDPEDGPEGRLLTRVHQVRERNRQLVERKKTAVLKETGRLACEACSFEFRSRYGERGTDFIECHHTRPVETLVEGSRTKLSELAVLCANCHRMVHARRPWLSITELKNLLIENSTSPS